MEGSEAAYNKAVQRNTLGIKTKYQVGSLLNTTTCVVIQGGTAVHYLIL